MLWRVTLLAALAAGKVGRRQESDWPPLHRGGPLSNEIQLSQIKWPDILVSSGEGALISERRPLRKSWCQTRQFQLRLEGGDGCASRSVAARLCEGQCTSLWVPRAAGGPWSSCPVCRPVRGGWVTPSLLCEGGTSRPAPRIYKAKKCRCREPGTDLSPGLQ